MEICVRGHDEGERCSFCLGLVVAHHVGYKAGTLVFGDLDDTQRLAVHGGRTPFDEVAYGLDYLGSDAGVLKNTGGVGIAEEDIEGFVINDERCGN